MKKFEIPHLASSIIWWLNYISAVGRSYVFSESAIKIPASEYLGSIDIKNIQLEYSHPKLYLKRFDLFFQDNQSNIENAFEFKYVKEDSTRDLDERKRIFYDLMRLHLFIEPNKKGYFLICGIQDDFKLSFENLNIYPKFINSTSKTTKLSASAPSFYSEWFSFDETNPIKTINLNSIHENYEPIYAAFMDNYSPSYLEKAKTKLLKPATIKTNLIFLSQENLASKIPQTIKIGIWEVV